MNASIRVKDKTGTVQTVYPNTIIANVEGLQAALDSKGEVSKVKVGSTAYNPSSGVVSLPAYPTTLPASDVSSWAKAASKPTYTASEIGAIATTAKGAASGVAELDANGKVPSSQLPAYVDDVLEYTAKSSFPTTGETGKIYVDTTTNLTYRWSGSAYVEISPSLALGTTSSTAYRGDRGNTAYSHATDSSRLTTAQSSGLYKISTTAQGHIASVTAVAKSDITGLGIPGSDTNTHRPIQVNGTQVLGDNTTALNLKAGSNVSISNSSGTVTIAATDTTYSAATQSAAGLMSSTDKTKLDGIATGATAVSESTVSGWGFTKNTGTYSKPSTGIPKTDLASAVQTSLGKADSALQSHQTIKQDGITGATVNRFGTCSIAAGTAAKTVSITTGTFALEAGARVTVKFSNANTASSPTLNVNSTGAKNIFHKGAQITTGTNKGLLAGTVDFIYDGTQWHLIGNYIDTNTTYSSKSAASGGTDVSLVTTGEKYTWNNKGNGTVTSVKVGSTSYSPSSGVVSLPAYPTTLPASDVSSWAKASSKPSYTQDEVSDGSTYKRVSATEKTTWNNKQNALIIGDYSLDLNSLTYVQSASGMYYSTDVYVGAFNRIFSAMAYDFASLKTTDNVNIMISTDRKKIVILSNVNSFNPGAALELQIVGI